MLLPPTPSVSVVIKRLFASLVLAAFALSFAVPPYAGTREPCPGADGTTTTTVAAPGHSTCYHGGANPCMNAVGCVAVAPALAAPVLLFVGPDHLLVFSARLDSRSGDLFRTGPPTPPPDLT